MLFILDSVVYHHYHHSPILFLVLSYCIGLLQKDQNSHMQPQMDVSCLAQLHFVAERTARHLLIWKDQEDAPPCPDFGNRWSTVTPTLRNVYIERVKYLSKAHGQEQSDYDSFVKRLYEHCYGSMDPLTAEMTSCIGFAEFTAQVKRFGSTDAIMVDALPDEDDILYVSERSVKVKREKVEPSSDDDALFVSPGPSVFLKAEKLEIQQSTEDISRIPEYSAVPKDEILDDPFYEEADLVEGLAMDYDLQDAEDPQVAVLETAVIKGTDALGKLQEAMERHGIWKTDSEWMPEIERTRNYTRKEKVIIGVVGTTGAGKSSLINAILDEINLVATDCMRASTAVATEISYNHGAFKYRAEVEFIQRQEWNQELGILYAEVQDHYDIVRRGEALTDSHAAVALEKIKAVYPALTPQDILDASIENLMGNEKVAELLDTMMEFEEDDPKVFAEKLKLYIHSKGKRGRPKKGAARTQAPDEQADSTYGLDLTGHGIGLWPLVRVVRIYIKAAALKTGAILVDLPGVFDSNAARVAVAEDYMKRCSSHWIVAPINRAVDDKVARDLLNRNHRRQIQMDSAFNDITFICTKTDDIATTEVIQTLDLDLPAIEEPIEFRAKCRSLKRDIKALKRRLFKNNSELDRIEPKMKDLEERLTGEFSFTQSQLSPKKPPAKEGRLSQGQRLLCSFHDLKSRRKELHNERRSIHQQIDAREKQLQQAIDARQTQEYHRLRTCIEARNDFSKEEMKRDFVRGMVNMYQDNIGDDNTRTRVRDYREVEKGLPVFCVSSRAYQELRGRCERGAKLSGYARLEETEIPQLQRHCIALTEEARKSSARRFLVHLNQLFQSMSLWASVTNTADMVSKRKRQEIEADFNKDFGKLEKGLRELENNFSSGLEDIFRGNVINDLEGAWNWANSQYPQTVSHWNAPGKEGGLHWQTYRATCRRNGVFKNKDMNQELAEPMLDKIVTGWQRAFEILIPQRFQELIDNMDKRVCRFHKDVINSGKQSVNDESKKMLGGTVKAYRKSIRQLIKQQESYMKAQQKQSSRIISDAIATELGQVYQECVAQTGKGTLAKMRDIMKHQAEANGENVFQSSARGLERELLNLVKQTRDKIAEIIGTILGWASRDYRGALVEPQIRRFSEQQVRMRKEMREVIEKTEKELQLDDLLDGDRLPELGAAPDAGETKDGGR